MHEEVESINDHPEQNLDGSNEYEYSPMGGAQSLTRNLMMSIALPLSNFALIHDGVVPRMREVIQLCQREVQQTSKRKRQVEDNLQGGVHSFLYSRNYFQCVHEGSQEENYGCSDGRSTCHEAEFLIVSV